MLRRLLEEQLLDPLEKAWGARLRAAVIVGSASGFMDAPDPPLLGDVNLVLVVDVVDLGLLGELRRHLAPRDLEDLEVLLLAEHELPSLLRTFPLEAGALRRRRLVLKGRDPFAGLRPEPWMAEHQAASEVLAHRQRLRAVLAMHAPTEPDTGRVALEMSRAFLALARHLLQARGVEPGPGLEDLLAWLQARARLSDAGAEAIRDLRATREDRRRPAAMEKRALLAGLLEAWDCLGHLVADWRPRRQGARRAPRRLRGRERRRRR